jgi:hypothetical protein
MQQEKEHFLNLKTPPARLTAEETAWFLGFSPHEIPVLMTDGLLKPLGHPPRNGPKFFAAAELEERRRDVKWLAKASDSIVAHWQNKNSRKSPAQDGLRLANREESASVEA